jgi:hypothetical protein
MEFGPYDFGTERILQQYEAYAGIRFRDRSIQSYTLQNKVAPNPVITSPLNYDASFIKMFKHCINLNMDLVPLDDYNFWALTFNDIDGVELFRKDIGVDEITLFKTKSNIEIWVEFETIAQPSKWTISPHSLLQGWCGKIEEILPI